MARSLPNQASLQITLPLTQLAELEKVADELGLLYYTSTIRKQSTLACWGNQMALMQMVSFIRQSETSGK